MDTIKLKKYNGKEGVGKFKAITIKEAKELQDGNYIWYYRRYKGDVVRVMIYGKPRTWETTPDRVEVPIKYEMYGIYDYRTINSIHILNGTLLKEV